MLDGREIAPDGTACNMVDGTENHGVSGDAACPLDVEVRGALERTTSQPPFARSLRLSQFLTYIVEETLAGRSDRLSGYSIGIDVFDKPEDFDPQVDTNVRVEAARLRRSLDRYYREAGIDDPVEFVVPKGTYVPEFRYRAGNRVITAQVAPPGPDGKTSADRAPSIAVLPFENYSGSPDDQFVAEGLTEETIANLARFKDLSVLSRTTTTKLVRDGADPGQLHVELGVDFIVEGSVRKSSDAVRVTVQLIDAKSDAHVLSDKFERPCTPGGVFEIQDEIALLIVGRIADHRGSLGRYITRARRAGQSKRWESYSWITRFYDYNTAHLPERHLEVREGLGEALEQDPDSSDGHAAFAILLIDEYRFHLNERPDYPALEQALQHALNAVACDPDNAFAYQALASAHFHRQDFPEFKVSAKRAMDLNPGHADMLADMGLCFCCLGEWDRGLPLIDRAIDLSPIHPGWYRLLPATHHALAGDFEDAVFELKSAPIPALYWYHACLAWFFAELGNRAEASKAVDELLTIYPSFAEHAQAECQIWCLHVALAEGLVAGWRKAGLEIS